VPASNNSSIRFNCGKQVIIHVNSNKIFLKFLIHHLLLTKPKSGNDFPKSPELLPLNGKTFPTRFYRFRCEILCLKGNS
jgi:hypothetical protein